MRIHYEKVICACCFIVLFTNIGLPSTSFAVYQPYIVALPGVGDVGGSLILAIRILVSLGVMFVVDRYYRLLDIRNGTVLAMLITAAGFFAYGIADGLPQFIAGAILCGIGYGLGGMIAATMLVNRWFASGVGTALGVASVGSGVASFVIPAAAVRLIDAFSLHVAFQCEAALAAMLAILVFVFLRNRPSDKGLAPYESRVVGRRTRRSSARGRTVATGLSRRAHRFLLAAMMGVGAFSMGGVAYLSVLFASDGIGLHFAALLVSVAGICLTVAKFTVGEIIDRAGTRVATVLMFVILVCGLTMCCMIPWGGAPLAFAAAVCVGMGVSLGSVGTSVWSLELSDDAHRSKYIRDCQIGYAFGGLVMNVLPGPLKVLSGSYAASYALMAILAVSSAAIILRIYRRYGF